MKGRLFTGMVVAGLTAISLYVPHEAEAGSPKRHPRPRSSAVHSFSTSAHGVLEDTGNMAVSAARTARVIGRSGAQHDGLNDEAGSAQQPNPFSAFLVAAAVVGYAYWKLTRLAKFLGIT